MSAPYLYLNNMKWTPLPSDNFKWLAVDFDQTIAHNSGYPNFIPTTPLEGCKEAIDTLVSRGYKIIIHTARPWADYDNIEKWCIENSITFRRIVCGKLLAKIYIDDKNFNTTIDWKEIGDNLL